MGASQSQPMCQEWHPLRCPCPTDCDDTEVRDWVHKCCGGTTFINSDAYVKCTQHDKPAPMANCYWACSNHHGEFKAVCKDNMIHSLIVAAGISQTAGDKVWAKRLVIATSKFRGT